MRTNIVIDDDLIAEAMKLTGIKTKRALVEEALRRLVRLERQRALLALRGNVEFDEDYDYKEMRKFRFPGEFEIDGDADTG